MAQFWQLEASYRAAPFPHLPKLWKHSSTAQCAPDFLHTALASGSELSG